MKITGNCVVEVWRTRHECGRTMTKGQLEEEIQYFRKIFQEIRLFPIGNISDIDEEWRKINEGQNCYHY